MASYGVAEAKNNFTLLLDRVQEGESITITKHGKQVAQITPMPKRDPEKRRAVMAELAEIRRQQKPLRMTVVELLHMDDEPER
ncbi:MAG: type II toxin-antitoxin system prevent-host-death family antitoxin [Alphaproteobacteria bacterium]|nr:type II toxin-antitoxin system prevent-host-death family antitoxin [Alphaproteobacteria bacterium]MBU2378179.1 type II toxin-antitoxin system prevent-host-death family antitoxin [Alphaproteobacteria bacterium]